MRHEKSTKQIMIIVAVAAITLLGTKMIADSRLASVFDAAKQGVDKVQEGIKEVQETLNHAGEKITKGKEFIDDKVKDVSEAGQKIGEAYDAVKEIGE